MTATDPITKAHGIGNLEVSPNVAQKPFVLSPTALALSLIGVIFFEQIATLLVLSQFTLPDWTESVIDAGLLVILVIPVLYFLHLKPMRFYLAEREASARAVQQAKDTLELRIAERTAELAAASQELQSSLQRLEKTHREDSLIAELVELLQSCRSVKESADILRLFGQKLFPKDCGAIYGYRASRNLLELTVSWGACDAQDMFSPEDCWALRRGRPHLVEPEDISLHCQHLGKTSADAMCIPMMAQGEATGVLVLRSGSLAGKNSGLSADTKRIAVLAAEQIALALANLDLREKLRDQAIRDPLTGMFNRRYFEETAERELNRAESREVGAAVIIIDIDHFKRFNDTYGHEAGDAVLKKFALLLQSKARVEDVACRYGGEEFALLLSGTPLHVAVARMESLREAVKDLELRYRGETLGTISISCGIASFPEQGRGLAELAAAADRALYQAKHAGRDRVLASQ